MNDTFVLGDYNVVTACCGRKRKASQCKLHWQGQLMCREHWEPRHPQDFVGPAPSEDNSVPIVQRPTTPTFIDSDIPDYEPYDPNTDENT